MLNWKLRYTPVIRLLERLDAHTVLDVGSGWHGLSWYWPRPVVQTDLFFAGEPPDPQARVGSALLVRADAARLPLRDAAVDVGVSLDLLEHLPLPLREPALHELARVSRRAFIVGYPVGPTAARADRRLATLLSWTPRRSVPPWLKEHLAQDEYPATDWLRTALPPRWHISAEIGSGNAALLTALVYAEHLPVLGWLTLKIERSLKSVRLLQLADRGRTYRRIFLVERLTAEGGEGAASAL